MTRKKNSLRHLLTSAVLAGVAAQSTAASAADLALSDVPLFVSEAVPPLALLVMGRDHKLYYEAYNDASDLNGDGVIDVGYKPDEIDYFGYFDSYKCYDYDSGVFEPEATTADKRCLDAERWSGDFLNYLTMSRMDALRKVLYGGHRSTDTAGTTILERSHIPQDAHSWGKEYRSIAVDGYDIRDYSPLGLPQDGTRHLFANTSLGYDQPPLLRVLDNSGYRIWEWVSIERPVAGTRCEDGGTGPTCARAATVGSYEIAPDSFFDSLTRSFYALTTTTPTTAAEFQTLVDNLGAPLESATALNIDSTESPTARTDNFVTVFRGEFTLDGPQTIHFGIDGDDAVELLVDGDVVVGWYGDHSTAGNGSSHTGSKDLYAGTHEIEFRHVEASGSAAYRLYLRTDRPASTLRDYTVRLEVCVPGLLEDNCQRYGASGDGDGESDEETSYKPTGLLHDFGASNRMLFGLLTGSYGKNTSGGVLRRNVGSFSTEIDPATGVFLSDFQGIVNTVDRLRTAGFDYGDHTYGCGWDAAGRPINEGECVMWGNPVGEMMYEGLRYFAGLGAATPDYAISAGEAALNLPVATWENPYAEASTARDAGANYCSKPFQLVISDINPSYDSDQVPGSGFAGGWSSGDIDGLSVSSELGVISAAEPGIPGTYFIGEAGGVYTGSPTPKSVTNLATARGLAPEEPTKFGSYSAAGIAYYGNRNDITNAPDEPSSSQSMQTFAVALASPLPRIEIPTDAGTVTLVPFAKSVGGGGYGITAIEGNFQPTNQIVDFYVETVRNVSGFPTDPTVNDGRPYYRFRINFEDVEQGADHDMDAIVLYEIKLNADGSVTVNLDSTYAAGGIIQHMGYVISGTTADGTYLEVRDEDTGDTADPDYYLDTPPGVAPGAEGDLWNDDAALPLTATRTFTPSGESGAGFLENPLWFAAKWGGFLDRNGNDRPDGTEWDRNEDGNPDNYFLVTNAGNLKTQLTTAFEQILARTASAGSASFNGGSLQADTLLYQVRFNSEDWSGELLAYNLREADTFDADGNLDQIAGTVESLAWTTADTLNDTVPDERVIVSWRPAADGTLQGGNGIPFRWPTGFSLDGYDLATVQPADLAVTLNNSGELTASQVLALSRIPGTGDYDLQGEERLEYVRGSDGDFRDRDTVLGDIVQSTPEYVGRSQFLYPDDWGENNELDQPEDGNPYSEFRYQYRERREMLYVGANDGMLHAFDANTGEEVFAYVPSAVYRDLTELTAEDYSHRYFVDGSPVHADVYFDDASNPGWRSILVGGLRKGGQGIYALDITSPPQGGTTETSVAQNVLWEFTDAQNRHLGYTYARPTVARLADGEWYVIVGNGYNNTVDDGQVGDGIAGLFLIPVEGGDEIWVPAGTVNSAAGPDTSGRPNGLSSVTVSDVDGDFVTDYAYAGDLRGNLWRFDLTGNSPTATRIFTATSPEGEAQPITMQPVVADHPEGKVGSVVYFGTGKYLENVDKNVDGQATQTLYAIWDAGALGEGENGSNVTFPVTRSQLLEQNVLANSLDGRELRVTTAREIAWTAEAAEELGYASAHRGWYLDLVIDGESNNGERLISDITLRSDRLIFNTFVPSQDPCVFGGGGWLTVLDYESGAREDRPTFDLNSDGDFDAADLSDLSAIDPAADANDPESVSAVRVGAIGTAGITSGRFRDYVITLPGDGSSLLPDSETGDGTADGEGEGDGDGDGDTGGDGSGDPVCAEGDQDCEPPETPNCPSAGNANCFVNPLNPALGETGRQSWREVL